MKIWVNQKILGFYYENSGEIENFEYFLKFRFYFMKFWVILQIYGNFGLFLKFGLYFLKRSKNI